MIRILIRLPHIVNTVNLQGFYHKLGPRIYPKDQPIPHDHDLFLQCYNCGRIENRVHSKQLNEIAPIVDPLKSIHDSGNVRVISANSGPAHRRSRAIIKQIKESRPGARRRKAIEEDQDIQRMLQSSIGKKLVSYQDSNNTRNNY